MSWSTYKRLTCLNGRDKCSAQKRHETHPSIEINSTSGGKKGETYSKGGSCYQISHRCFKKGRDLIEMRFFLSRETWPRADFSKTYQRPPPYVSALFFLLLRHVLLFHNGDTLSCHLSACSHSIHHRYSSSLRRLTMSRPTARHHSNSPSRSRRPPL